MTEKTGKQPEQESEASDKNQEALTDSQRLERIESIVSSRQGADKGNTNVKAMIFGVLGVVIIGLQIYQINQTSPKLAKSDSIRITKALSTSLKNEMTENNNMAIKGINNIDSEINQISETQNTIVKELNKTNTAISETNQNLMQINRNISSSAKLAKSAIPEIDMGAIKNSIDHKITTAINEQNQFIVNYLDENYVQPALFMQEQQKLALEQEKAKDISGTAKKYVARTPNGAIVSINGKELIVTQGEKTKYGVVDKISDNEVVIGTNVFKR